MSDHVVLTTVGAPTPSGRAKAKPVTAAEKGYARAAVRLKVARAVWALWDRLRAEDGVDQTWLVERLGTDKGRVSRLLNGSGNWTLDTVADLLEAMEARLTAVEAKPYRTIDAACPIEPSLSGLRDNPSLWNIVELKVDGEDNVARSRIDAVSAMPLPQLARRNHIVSRESE